MITTKQKINYSIIKNIRDRRAKNMICEFCNGSGNVQYIRGGEKTQCKACEGSGLMTKELRDKLHKKLSINK